MERAVVIKWLFEEFQPECVLIFHSLRIFAHLHRGFSRRWQEHCVLILFGTRELKSTQNNTPIVPSPLLRDVMGCKQHCTEASGHGGCIIWQDRHHGESLVFLKSSPGTKQMWGCSSMSGDVCNKRRFYNTASKFIVLVDLDKEREQGSGCQSHPSDTMGRQSIFQRLYNKYSRKNIFSDFYSKVIVTLVFPSSADCPCALWHIYLFSFARSAN